MKAILQDVVSIGGGLSVEAGVEPPDSPYGEAAAITLKIAGHVKVLSSPPIHETN
jgi:hypothetical protein